MNDQPERDLEKLPGTAPKAGSKRISAIFFGLGFQHLATTVKTIRADVMTQMHFTGRRLKRSRRCGQKVVRTVHTTLGGGFFILLNSHDYLLIPI
jgi:hypothetical protein